MIRFEAKQRKADTTTEVSENVQKLDSVPVAKDDNDRLGQEL